MATFYRWQGEHLILHCQLQPKASKDAFTGVLGERLKIRITAPPVDGKANKHLIKLLAKRFGVNQTAVEIVSGLSSRQKTLRIQSPSTIPPELSALDADIG